MIEPSNSDSLLLGTTGGTGRSPARRRGSLSLELVLVLPILVLLIVTIIQFGLFHTSMEQVSLACRVGAREAAQTPGLSTTNGDPVPNNVLEAIEKQLGSSRMHACKVRLEHNVGGSQVALISSSNAACDAGSTCQLPVPAVTGQYVRVSICVPQSALMPRCLNMFGCELSDPCDMVGGSTVMRYDP